MLILHLPVLPQCFVLRVVKAIESYVKGKKWKQGLLRSHLRIILRSSSTEGRALTNFANPCRGCSQKKYLTVPLVIMNLEKQGTKNCDLRLLQTR